ncbi:MAG: DUF2147 domain-containing protein [Steroidobacter sp.]
MFAKSSTLLSAVVATALLLMSVSLCAADDPRMAIQGNWLTEPQDGIIQITANAQGVYEGRIVGGNSPGKLDSNNPDPAKRTLVLRGQVIMHDMKYDGDGQWSGGTIYDPDSGSTYKCKLQLRDDGALKVRGYIGFSLLGRTQIWTRYTGTSMDLPKH